MHKCITVGFKLFSQNKKVQVIYSDPVEIHGVLNAF